MKRVVTEEIFTAEFFIYQNALWIEYNSRKMPMTDFLTLAKKKDYGALTILKAVKDKMQASHYRGTMIDYIKAKFSDYTRPTDIVVRVGTNKEPRIFFN